MVCLSLLLSPFFPPYLFLLLSYSFLPSHSNSSWNRFYYWSVRSCLCSSYRCHSNRYRKAWIRNIASNLHSPATKRNMPWEFGMSPIVKCVFFFLLPTKIYILLSTQNILKLMGKKFIDDFTVKNCVYQIAIMSFFKHACTANLLGRNSNCWPVFPTISRNTILNKINLLQFCDILTAQCHSILYFRNPNFVCLFVTLRDVSYNARWFWTTIRYGPMTTAYLCWTTGNGF